MNSAGYLRQAVLVPHLGACSAGRDTGAGVGAGEAGGAAAWSVLPFGPVTEMAIETAGVALLTGTLGIREPAYWKRYRGGISGRLWTRPPLPPATTAME